MPDTSSLSLSGARIEAVAGKARLANSVLHCFQAGWVPGPTNVLADFLAHEADFDGYTPKTVATWSDPVLAGSGYAIYAPTQTFPWSHVADDVGNQIGGTFLVTSGGDLYQYTIYDPTRSVQGPDQAVVTTPTDVFPVL